MIEYFDHATTVSLVTQNMTKSIAHKISLLITEFCVHGSGKQSTQTVKNIRFLDNFKIDMPYYQATAI